MRRKSLINNAANIAAVAAAAGVADVDKLPALPVAIGPRRASRSGGFRPDLASLTNLPSHAASVPVEKIPVSQGAISREDAVDDQEDILPEEGASLQGARDRRASDGHPITKEGRRFNRPVIKCDQCHKQYKHNSCLTKHKFVSLSFLCLVTFLSGPILEPSWCATTFAGHYVDMLPAPDGNTLKRGRTRRDCLSQSISKSKFLKLPSCW